MTKITITANQQGWNAVFQGGDMPQGIAVPLPFASQAPTGRVASDLLRRFPGCEVHSSIGVYRRALKAA